MKVLLLSSLLACAAFGADGARILRTVAEVQSLTDADYAAHLPFELHGAVVASIYKTSTIIRDKTGATVVHLDISGTLHPGDRIVASGRLEVSDKRKNHLFASSAHG